MINFSAANMKERGAVPRKLQKLHRQAKKAAWPVVGQHFHEQFRPKRFTAEHAQKAGYAKRKGEGLAFGSKQWKRSTMGQKFRKSRARKNRQADAMEPLVFSGDTRARSEIATVTATSKGVKVKYSGARKLNFQHSKSRINMRKEFVTLTKPEMMMLAHVFDWEFDQQLKLQG